MKGYIEIKEDAYDDTIEHLHRLKTIACKMIKKLEENSDIYDDEYNEEMKSRSRGRNRYDY